VPRAEREGVGDPAPALRGYEDMLFDSWREHLPADAAHGSLGSAERTDRNQPEFRRFLESQLVWDRAIAEGMAEAAARHPGAVVVGLMGSGHVMHGWGVSHQLKALGRPAPLALLPFEREADCAALAGGPAARLADAVFGVATPARVAAPARPRLGITLEPAVVGVGIAEVANGSIAKRAGLEKGDVILVIAGRAPKSAADVAAAVMRQAPGTWLPIEVQRGEQRLELVARFPPAPED
jgi:membrane-associated protease RseP (regulator of RpoE activity)